MRLSRIVALALIVVPLCAMACAGASPTNSDSLLGITRPVRLSTVAGYLDGGTVGVVLVGAHAETLRAGIDGRGYAFRVRVDDRGRAVGPYSTPHQRHCYVGSEYPTGHGARLLPLWGREERALIGLLTRVIDDTLSSDEARRLLLTSRSMDLPGTVSVDMWHFVRAVSDRQQTLEAIDHGLLSSSNSALRYFGLVGPVRADSIGVDSVSGRFVVHIHDAQATTFRLSFPASLDSVMSPSSGSWPVRATWGYNLAGDLQDRWLMTVASMALGAGPYGGGRPQERSLPAKYQGDRAKLLALLKMRTTRILEADASD